MTRRARRKLLPPLLRQPSRLPTCALTTALDPTTTGVPTTAIRPCKCLFAAAKFFATTFRAS